VVARRPGSAGDERRDLPHHHQDPRAAGRRSVQVEQPLPQRRVERRRPPVDDEFPRKLLVEERAGKVGAVDVHAPDKRVPEDGALQIGAHEVRPREIGVLQHGAAQIGVGEDRPLELGGVEPSPCEPRAGEVGILEHGVAQVDPRCVKPGQADGPEVRPLPGHLAEERVRDVRSRPLGRDPDAPPDVGVLVLVLDAGRRGKRGEGAQMELVLIRR
jgi:hypothetical protein